MCRMMAVVARGPIPYELFEELADLADLGKTQEGPPDERGHKEGWGILGLMGPDVVDYTRGAGSARGDPQFARAAWSLCKRSLSLEPGQTIVALAHVRRSSDPATKNRTEFSHPFLREHGEALWAFQHNGGLNRARLEDLGTLDSIHLFEHLLGTLGDGGPDAVEAAYQEAKAYVLDRFGGYSSLTSILANGQGVHAYREAARAPEYYTLWYEAWEDLAIVASEPLLGMRGRLLDQGEALRLPADGDWPR